MKQTVEQTVYVLTLSYSTEGRVENEVLGVYSDLGLAQKIMNDLGDRNVEYLKNDWEIDEDNADEMIVEKDDTYYNVYIKCDGYHEYLTIYSRQIDFDGNY